MLLALLHAQNHPLVFGVQVKKLVELKKGLRIITLLHKPQGFLIKSLGLARETECNHAAVGQAQPAAIGGGVVKLEGLDAKSNPRGKSAAAVKAPVVSH